MGLSEAKFFVKLVELIGFSYVLYVLNLNNRFVFTNDDALLAAMDEGMPSALEMVGEVEDEFVSWRLPRGPINLISPMQ